MSDPGKDLEPTTSEEGVSQDSLEQAVGMLRAVTALGRTATALEQQAGEIRRQLESIVSTDAEEYYLVPEGKVLKVTCMQPILPGQLIQPPILEILEGEIGKQKWVPIPSDVVKYDVVMKPTELSPQQITYTFFGGSIEYDYDNAIFWVYNDDIDARVQLTENVQVSEISNPALAPKNQ